MHIVVNSDAQETAKQGAILGGTIMGNEEPNITAGCPSHRLKTSAKHRQIGMPNGSFPEKPGPILVENPFRLIPRPFRRHRLPPLKVRRATNDDWLCHCPPIIARWNLLAHGRTDYTEDFDQMDEEVVSYPCVAVGSGLGSEVRQASDSSVSQLILPRLIQK
jgi:hypothetical protein